MMSNKQNDFRSYVDSDYDDWSEYKKRDNRKVNHNHREDRKQNLRNIESNFDDEGFSHVRTGSNR